MRSRAARSEAKLDCCRVSRIEEPCPSDVRAYRTRSRHRATFVGVILEKQKKLPLVFQVIICHFLTVQIVMLGLLHSKKDAKNAIVAVIQSVNT